MQLSTREALTSITHQPSTAKHGYDEHYFGIYDIYEKATVDVEDVRLIRRLVGEYAVILDVGCGIGNFVRLCKGSVGLDLSEYALKYSEEGSQSVRGTAAALPFKDETFHVVRMRDLLEHLHDPLSGLREAYRTLRKRGILIIRTPTPYSVVYPIHTFYDDHTHVKPFGRIALMVILRQAGFSSIRIHGRTYGKTLFERAASFLLSRFMPFEWLVLASKSQATV